MATESDVPWDQLLVSDNLQQVLRTILRRLNRQDNVIAECLGGNDGGGDKSNNKNNRDTPAVGHTISAIDHKPFTIIATSDFTALKQRLDILENTTLQSRLDDLQKNPSLHASSAAKAHPIFRLADHVIPLSKLKARVDGCDAGIQANASGIDTCNDRVTAFIESIQSQLSKMVTKEEFEALEKKHVQLEERVEALAKDIIERLEKQMKEVQKQLEKVVTRVNSNEERLGRVQTKLHQVDASLEEMKDAIQDKADTTYVDEIAAELREALQQINLDEIRELFEKANHRVDLMDERCDKLEDEHQELRKEFAQYQKDMQDMQLEHQIEQLRRELEDAKTGVFMKATARMDVMQRETNQLRDTLTNTQGQVQLNRESLEEVEDAIRQLNPDAIDTTSNRGTRAIIEHLQRDIAKLEQKYAEASTREAEGKGRAEETEQLLEDLRHKLDELHKAKADKNAVELALNIKADKDAVARDTERNLRAVDEALTVMNAGTQGMQQLLDKQETFVQQLASQLSNKLDREEIEKIQKQVNNQQISPEEALEKQEAIFGKYGLSLEEAAAGMKRPLEQYTCISCNRPIRPQSYQQVQTLPLLPSAKDGFRVPSSASRRAQSASGQRGWDGVVEVSEIPRFMRSAGGSHTSPRLMQGIKDQRPARPTTVEVRREHRRNIELLGEDGRIYYGHVSPRSSRPSSGK